MTRSSLHWIGNRRHALLCVALAFSLQLQALAVDPPADSAATCSQILAGPPQASLVQSRWTGQRFETLRQRHASSSPFLLWEAGGPAEDRRQGAAIMPGAGLPAFTAASRPGGRSPPDRISF